MATRPNPASLRRRPDPRATATIALLVATLLVASSCVGSGKTARTQSIEPLPAGISVVSDVTMGCREGESGFDYRFIVIGKTNDVSAGSVFLTSLRNHGFYHSIGLADDLPWVSVGYQNETY